MLKIRENGVNRITTTRGGIIKDALMVITKVTNLKVEVLERVRETTISTNQTTTVLFLAPQQYLRL